MGGVGGRGGEFERGREEGSEGGVRSCWMMSELSPFLCFGVVGGRTVEGS